MASVPPAVSEAHKGTEKLLDGIGDLLTTLLEGPAAGDEAGSLDALDAQLSSFFHSFAALRSRHQATHLTVAILALTKSGKSTLLNSLISAECLPMNNVPETARICKIMHDAAAKEPSLLEPAAAIATTSRKGSNANTAPLTLTAKGEKAVRARLQQLNSDARSLEPASSLNSASSLGSATSASLGVSGSPGGVAGSSGGQGGGGGVVAGVGGSAASEPMLEIRTPLTALEMYSGQEFGQLTLLDTPGPNEAGEERLRYQVERLLDGVDAVLYLLDYTKLKTADEADLFARLTRINPQLVARLSQRLFFVVNKADTMDTGEGLDADETREYVAQLVTRQLACAGFTLRPEQVILLSARNALLARLVLAGRASPDSLKRFMRLAFGAVATRSIGGPSQEQIMAAANAMLDESGILDLEARVLTFLAAHAASVKCLATVDDCVRLLGAVNNVAASCRACLCKRAEQLSSEAAALQSELQTTLDAFDGVMSDADAVQAEVSGEIRSHLSTLRSRLFSHIIHTLDVDGPRTTTPLATGAGASSGRDPNEMAAAAAAVAGSNGGAAPAGAASAGRWRRLREKFMSIFTSTSGSSGPTGGPGASARSRSKEELARLLSDLHDDLLGQLHAEVGEFWRLLEAVTAGRHAELLNRLNAHLTDLSRRVEGAVAARLCVDLAPVDITMRLPSAEEFHSNLHDLINNGIVATQEKHIRVGTRQTTERVLQFRGGICKWGAYWVDVPRTRTVVETYSITVFALQPHEIANHFIQMVDAAISASEKALDAYVAAYVHGQLAEARRHIQEYSDRYLAAMAAALDASSRGAEAQASALGRVEGHLAALEGLRAQAGALQRAAEAAVPRLHDAEPYDDIDEDEDAENGGAINAFVADEVEGDGVNEEEMREAEAEVAREYAEMCSGRVASPVPEDPAPAPAHHAAPAAARDMISFDETVDEAAAGSSSAAAASITTLAVSPFMQQLDQVLGQAASAPPHMSLLENMAAASAMAAAAAAAARAAAASASITAAAAAAVGVSSAEPVTDETLTPAAAPAAHPAEAEQEAPAATIASGSTDAAYDGDISSVPDIEEVMMEEGLMTDAAAHHPYCDVHSDALIGSEPANAAAASAVGEPQPIVMQPLQMYCGAGGIHSSGSGAVGAGPVSAVLHQRSPAGPEDCGPITTTTTTTTTGAADSDGADSTARSGARDDSDVERANELLSSQLIVSAPMPTIGAAGGVAVADSVFANDASGADVPAGEAMGSTLSGQLLLPFVYNDRSFMSAMSTAHTDLAEQAAAEGEGEGEGEEGVVAGGHDGGRKRRAGAHSASGSDDWTLVGESEDEDEEDTAPSRNNGEEGCEEIVA